MNTIHHLLNTLTQTLIDYKGNRRDQQKILSFYCSYVCSIIVSLTRIQQKNVLTPICVKRDGHWMQNEAVDVVNYDPVVFGGGRS